MLRYGRALHIIIITASYERACAARDGANKNRHQKRRVWYAGAVCLCVIKLQPTTMRSLQLENQRRGSGTACAICTEQLVCVCVCAPVAENWMILSRQKMHACCNLWPGKIEWPPPTPLTDSDLQPGQSSRTMTREWKVWHWQVARVRRERTPAVWNSKLFRSLQRDSRFIWRGSVT